MPGRAYTELLAAATGQYGYVTADDARAEGIDPTLLRVMAHRGILDRTARGVYRFPIVPATALDQYMEAVLWPRTRAVLSHETALDLHDVCDVNPARIHVTVPAGYRVRRQVPDVYELHERDLPNADVTVHEGIPVVSVYRAIVDGIEKHLGEHLIEQAMKNARARGLITAEELRALRRARNRGVAPEAQPAQTRSRR